MSFHKIGLVGATGNLGPSILKALLDAGFEVTILSREGSKSTDSIPSHANQKIVKVNFDSVDSITAALKGIDGVVSNVASHALPSQKLMIDAAIAAGVKRFIPSDFGSDISVPANQKVPFNAPKLDIHNYIVEKTKTHPNFSYTFVTNGPFFDWCLQVGIFGDLKNHTMTLWDGGNTKFSTTTLASVGKTVVGVFKNPEPTKNRDLRVQDTAISLKEIMAIVKEADGKEWTVKEGNTAEAFQAGLEEFKKPQPNFEFAIMNQLYRIIFSDEHGTDYSDKLDNDKVGLPLMTEEQVKGVIKSCMA